MMRCGDRASAHRTVIQPYFFYKPVILDYEIHKRFPVSPQWDRVAAVGYFPPPHRRLEQARARYSSFPGFTRLSKNPSHLGSGKSFFCGQVLLGRTECSGVFENGYCSPPANGNRTGFSPDSHYSPIFTICLL